MKRWFVQPMLQIAKWIGVFAIARRLTRGDLRILCYHGAALSDENQFRPSLFISRDTFARRMRILAEREYPVLALRDALDRLERGTLPPNATVITIDDGWYGTYAVMSPILARHRFPATLYIASYYLEKQTQVFNVALDYVFWRVDALVLDLSEVDPSLTGRYDLTVPAEREKAHDALNAYAASLDGAARRQEALRKICELVEFDWRMMETARIASFMTKDEARRVLSGGIDIQLHTHRHRFPESPVEALRGEIADNSRVLREITSAPLVHFCYPSGKYTRAQAIELSRLGIESATTAKAGFTRRGASRLELPRYLDADNVSDLEFEAELSGVFELVRRFRKLRVSSGATSAAAPA